VQTGQLFSLDELQPRLVVEADGDDSSHKTTTSTMMNRLRARGPKTVQCTIRLACASAACSIVSFSASIGYWPLTWSHRVSCVGHQTCRPKLQSVRSAPNKSGAVVGKCDGACDHTVPERSPRTPRPRAAEQLGSGAGRWHGA
jgi:hypothetical protein